MYVYDGKTFDTEAKVKSIEDNVSVTVIPAEDKSGYIAQIWNYVRGADGSITIDNWQEIETAAQHKEKDLERLDNVELDSQIPRRGNDDSSYGDKTLSGANINDPSLFLVSDDDDYGPVKPYFAAEAIADVDVDPKIEEWTRGVVFEGGVRSVYQLTKNQKVFYFDHKDEIDSVLIKSDHYIARLNDGIAEQCLFLAQIPVTTKKNKDPMKSDLSGGIGRLPWGEINSASKLDRECKNVAVYAKNNVVRPRFAQRLLEFDTGLTPSKRAALIEEGKRKANALSSQAAVGGSAASRIKPDAESPVDLDAALEGEYDDETLPAAPSAAPQAVPSTPAVAPAAPAPKAPSLHEEINAYLRTGAKDESAFERDRAHVVHFNTTSMNLPSRLMKGRDRYMKRLQAYVDGDASVKVRMMDNKEVLVSSLKPNMASLKKMLAASSGAPRFCDCA